MTAPAIETNQETEPKLRWYQYRLRSLMTLVIFIGLFTAAWTYSRKAERQAVQLRQAEKEVRLLDNALKEVLGHNYKLYPPEWRALVLKARRLEIGDPEENVLASLGSRMEHRWPGLDRPKGSPVIHRGTASLCPGHPRPNRGFETGFRCLSL